MFLRGVFGTAAASAVAACTSKDTSESEIVRVSKTFVLVHGAWHGGWCWKYVRDILQKDGHRVFTPTLTGLGERAHLLTPQIGLNTHIEDVIQHILFEELTDITLVGHSYGGMVITGVADQLKNRISHIVYLDAGLPDDGENFASQAPGISPDQITQVEAGFRAFSEDGVAMGVFPATVLGISPEDKINTAWVEKHITPHPLKTWLDPISLRNNGSAGVPRTYIHCNNPVLASSSFAAHHATLAQDQSWNTHLLATGHDAMVTAPVELSDILLTL